MELSCESLRDVYETLLPFFKSRKISPGIIKAIGFASGWTTVDATGEQSGMAFHFNGEHAVYGSIDPEPLTTLRPFIGKPLPQMIEYLLTQRGLLFRSVCMAALNALSHPFTEKGDLEARGIRVASDESLDFVQPTDVVTVVGYGRVIRALRQRGIAFNACDLRPSQSLRTLVIDDKIEWGPAGVTFYGGDQNQELLACSDVVLMTGCTLVNDTFHSLVTQCAKARVIGLFGPSAGLLPDYLLSTGVNFILHDRSVSKNGITHTLIDADRRNAMWDQFETVVIQNF